MIERGAASGLPFEGHTHCCEISLRHATHGSADTAPVRRATAGWAQDVLTVGSGIAQSGGTAAIPVSIRDLSGTALGVDAGAGNRIQGFAFKVLFPTELVSSVNFARAGVATTVTPLYDRPCRERLELLHRLLQRVVGPVAFTLNATAPGDRVGMLTVTLRGDSAVGSTASLILDPGSAMLSNQAGSVRETVAGGNLSLMNGSITVSALAAPTGVVATAQGTSQVNVSWTAVGGADHYEVWRSSFGDEYAIVGSPSAPVFTDSTVAVDTTYLYHVRAIDPSDPSGFSGIDPATTIVFTDDPLTARRPREGLHITSSDGLSSFVPPRISILSTPTRPSHHRRQKGQHLSPSPRLTKQASRLSLSRTPSDAYFCVTIVKVRSALRMVR